MLVEDAAHAAADVAFRETATPMSTPLVVFIHPLRRQLLDRWREASEGTSAVQASAMAGFGQFRPEWAVRDLRWPARSEHSRVKLKIQANCCWGRRERRVSGTSKRLLVLVRATLAAG